MNDEPTFNELLIENVQDWFYTNYHRSCYNNDEDYIDDIRTIIAECDSDIVEQCIDDLTDVYFISPGSLIGKFEYITELLVKEAKYSLDNFRYSSMDEDD